MSTLSDAVIADLSLGKAVKEGSTFLFRDILDGLQICTLEPEARTEDVQPVNQKIPKVVGKASTRVVRSLVMVDSPPLPVTQPEALVLATNSKTTVETLNYAIEDDGIAFL